MGQLIGVTKAQTELVNNKYAKIKADYPRISKGRWIIYNDLSEEEIQNIKDNYSQGSIFDRLRDNHKTWEIGTNRMSCKVGVILEIDENTIIMFMEKGSIHYKVTKEIIKIAKEIQ